MRWVTSRLTFARVMIRAASARAASGRAVRTGEAASGRTVRRGGEAMSSTAVTAGLRQIGQAARSHRAGGIAVREPLPGTATSSPASEGSDQMVLPAPYGAYRSSRRVRAERRRWASIRPTHWLMSPARAGSFRHIDRTVVASNS